MPADPTETETTPHPGEEGVCRRINPTQGRRRRKPARDLHTKGNRPFHIPALEGEQLQRKVDPCGKTVALRNLAKTDEGGKEGTQ